MTWKGLLTISDQFFIAHKFLLWREIWSFIHSGNILALVTKPMGTSDSCICCKWNPNRPPYLFWWREYKSQVSFKFCGMWSSQTTQPKMARRYKYFIWAAYHGKNASFPFGSLEKENINLAMHGSSKIKCPFHSCGRNWVARKLSLDPTKKC